MNVTYQQHRPRWRRTACLMTALLTALVAAACGSSSPTNSGSSGSSPSSSAAAAVTGGSSWAGSATMASKLDALYQAAVKAGETKIVLYGPYAQLYQPVWNDFAKRFPKLTIVGKVLPPSGTVAAIKAEVTSGRHVGDVVMQGLEGVAVPANEGLLQPYEPPNIGSIAPEYRDPHGRFVVQFGDIFGILYNTSKLTPSSLPTSLQELTDPKYKGEVIDDPATSQVTSFSLLPQFYDNKLTLSFLQALKANAKVVESSTPYYTQVVTGQVAMMPWASHSRYLALKHAGAPVGFAAEPGMASLILGATGIIKGAPDIIASKLFQAWFLTPEAQNDLVSKGNSVGLAKGITYPADWPNYQTLYQAEPQVPPENFADTLQRFLKFISPAFPS